MRIKKALILIVCFMLTISLCGCEQVLKELEIGMKDLTKAWNANESIYEYGECRLVITDGANVMTEEEEKQLATFLEPYCNKVDIDVLICTTNTASMSATKYGAAYISRFFPNGSEDNVSFVFDLYHKEWFVVWHGYLAEKMPDARAETAFDKGSPYFRKDQYAKGFQEMGKYLLTEISKIKK